jgi:hypothetical protein
LERLGLEIHYAPEAVAYHDHMMDLASFSVREFGVGRSAVILYRKHPDLDALIDVRWIGSTIDGVEELMNRPALLEKVRAVDAQGDLFLTGLARSLEDVLAVPDVAESGLTPTTRPEHLTAALDALYAAIFDLARTRGKVHEWFANVENTEKREAAKSLVGCIRKLDFLSQHADRITMPDDAPAQTGEIDELRTKLLALEGEAGTPWVRHTGERPAGRFLRIVPRSVRQRVAMPLRTADLAVQTRLHGRRRWLTAYLHLRNGLRRVVRGEPKARP